MTDSNQKPCMNCRKRKVRCDKQTPCANCVRSNTRCAYEDQPDGEAMAPLMLDKLTTIHLFDRLAGLEQMISKLSEVPLPSRGYRAEIKDTPSSIDSGGTLRFPFTPDQRDPTPSQGAFPSLEESEMLIQLFLELTEPFIKLVHVPFFRKQLADHRNGESPLYFAAALHCIHALALATLSSNFVLDFFRRPRDDLLVILRRQAEEALAEADFMRSPQPIVLRGLLYFINFLFEIGDNEYASSLVGVALRAALRIGLYHDFHEASLFVRDARRRIWLQLQHLDKRAVNLLRVDSIMKPEWDTPPPRNTFDETWEAFRTAREIFTDEPPITAGYADMSFVLARAEIEKLQEQIRSSDMPFDQMRSYIDEQQQAVWRKYLVNSGSKPLQRFMVGLLEILVNAVYLTARQAHHKVADEDFRTQTFMYAIELLEQTSALEAEIEYIQYMWMLRSFIPINAIITVLTCTLFSGSPDCEVRAWQQIDKVYARYDNADSQLAKSWLFESVNALREQALEVKRQRQMQMQR